MDACFELLVRRLAVSEKLQHQQRTFVWGGVEYPQEPDVYRFGPHVEVVVGERIPKHILARLLPDLRDSEWVYLIIKGDALDVLESEVNDKGGRWLGDTLEDFL